MSFSFNNLLNHYNSNQMEMDHFIGFRGPCLPPPAPTSLQSNLTLRKLSWLLLDIPV